MLAEAAKAITPLQDAIDLGEATPEEEVRLKAWKKFR
ncbi:tail fiber assembly protein, partial [Edwardsiella tarda]